MKKGNRFAPGNKCFSQQSTSKACAYNTNLSQDNDSENDDAEDDTDNMCATLHNLAKEQANMLAEKVCYAGDDDCIVHINMQIEAVEKPQSPVCLRSQMINLLTLLSMHQRLIPHVPHALPVHCSNATLAAALKAEGKDPV